MVNEIKGYIIAALVFGFFITAGVTYLAGFRNIDPTFGDSDRLQSFNNSFDILTETGTEVDKIQSSIELSKPEFSLFGAVNAIIQGAWETLKTVFNSFSFVSSAITALSSEFGIPTFIPYVIGVIMSIILIFAIYKAVFQVG